MYKLQDLCLAFTLHPLPASMSKSIFQATLSDPDVPDAGTEIEDDEEPGKSGDVSSDSEGQVGQQSPLIVEGRGTGWRGR